MTDLKSITERNNLLGYLRNRIYWNYTVKFWIFNAKHIPNKVIGHGLNEM